MRRTRDGVWHGLARVGTARMRMPWSQSRDEQLACSMLRLSPTLSVRSRLQRLSSSDLGVVTSSVRGDVFNPDGTPAGLPLFLSSERGIVRPAHALAPMSSSPEWTVGRPDRGRKRVA
jgi:hypothetical protein